jgi:hypothetical protein
MHTHAPGLWYTSSPSSSVRDMLSARRPRALAGPRLWPPAACSASLARRFFPLPVVGDALVGTESSPSSRSPTPEGEAPCFRNLLFLQPRARTHTHNRGVSECTSGQLGTRELHVRVFLRRAPVVLDCVVGATRQALADGRPPVTQLRLAAHNLSVRADRRCAASCECVRGRAQQRRLRALNQLVARDAAQPPVQSALLWRRTSASSSGVNGSCFSAGFSWLNQLRGARSE